jgi:GPI-anchor transamidase subunit GAA1
MLSLAKTQKEACHENDVPTGSSSSASPQITPESVASETNAENNSSSSSSSSVTTTNHNNSSTMSKMQRVWNKLIYVPYLVGIVWTCLHPRMSILTGENKCRGWYVDESALDTQFSSVQTYNGPPKPKYNPKQPPKPIFGLCDSFGQHSNSNNNSNNYIGWTHSNLICHRHHGPVVATKKSTGFDIAAVVPISGAIQPHEEAIVLVVPGCVGDWKDSEFHATLLHWFPRLANPSEIQWLAKTVYLVSPICTIPTESSSSSSSSEDPFYSLEETVSDFLDAYLGTREHAHDTVRPLPPQFSGAMLRNLIVLDVQHGSTTTIKGSEGMTYKQASYTDLAILPQGRRGILPNMDLVFVVGQLFSRAIFLNANKYPSTSIFVHPYREVFQKVQTHLGTAPPNHNNRHSTSLKLQAKYWAEDMTNLGLFAYSMAMGPSPPHAPALERGIDSLSLHVRFHGSSWSRNVMNDFFQVLEYLVRALSNLHERLHHSITLYLLPSPRTFVSHVEYLIPNLLMLLPLAIRAVGLLIWDIDRFHLSSAGWMVLSIIGVAVLGGASSILLTSLTAEDDLAMINACFMAPYMVLAVGWASLLQGYRAQKEDHQRIVNSLQFVVCLTAIYMHVPLAFAHASLGFPSALLWTVLLAFPKYSGSIQNKQWATWIGVAAVLMAAPPVLLVPRVFSSYTTYMRLVYIPLHVQLVLLVLSRLV